MGQIGIYVPVSVIFPGTEPSLTSFVSLLKQLSRTDVLFWCARLNSILTTRSDLGHEQKQAFGLQQFLSQAEVRRLSEFCSDQGRPTSSVTLFFRGQILELVRWATLYCDDHLDDGNTFEDPKTRRRFAQACLIASDLWSRRVYGDAFDLSDGVVCRFSVKRRGSVLR